MRRPRSPPGEEREARIEPRGFQGARSRDRLLVRDGLRPPHHEATLKLLRAIIVALLFYAALAAPARAVEPDEMLKDPALEARARTVSAELRCLVCQNESIDESHAPLAHDIRMLVRRRLEAGDTNQQVVDYLVARYGQFILLKPPFEAQTLLLWGTPLLVLVAGGLAIAVAARRRPARDPARPLSETEQRKLDELLGPSA